MTKNTTAGGTLMLSAGYEEVGEAFWRLQKEIFRLEHPDPVKPAGRLLPPNDLIPDLFP